MDDPGVDDEMARIRGRLTTLEAERAELASRLAILERDHRAAMTLSPPPQAATATEPAVTAASSAAEKVGLFRRLFAGRADVFPIRWENLRTKRSAYAPACVNEWVKGTCAKPQVKCGECPNQAFIPVSDAAVVRHLSGGIGAARGAPEGGGFVMGIYPLLPDETCRFLAADFDGASWAEDALAFVETCRAEGVPTALERSRSGEGGHLWIFFSGQAQHAGRERFGLA